MNERIIIPYRIRQVMAEPMRKAILKMCEVLLNIWCAAQKQMQTLQPTPGLFLSLKSKHQKQQNLKKLKYLQVLPGKRLWMENKPPQFNSAQFLQKHTFSVLLLYSWLHLSKLKLHSTKTEGEKYCTTHISTPSQILGIHCLPVILKL